MDCALAKENIGAKVMVDVNHGDLQALKREGVNLMLIPEDVSIYLDYANISREECYKLSHDEYENGDVTKVMEYIKGMQCC